MLLINLSPIIPVNDAVLAAVYIYIYIYIYISLVSNMKLHNII